MTGKRKRIGLSAILSSVKASSFCVEIKKSTRGAVAVVHGVMSINEYSEERVELLSHFGRMSILGEMLTVSVLQDRVVEIYGRITEVRLGYGRT